MTGGGHGAEIQPPYDAVIFDMDGVVTDTARLHATAWKRLFDEVLADPRARTDSAVQPFDAVEDYRRYVDGRRREDGITAFLDAREVDIPPGSPEDLSGTWTVHGLAARVDAIEETLKKRLGQTTQTTSEVRRRSAAGPADQDGTATMSTHTEVPDRRRGLQGGSPSGPGSLPRLSRVGVVVS